MRLGAVFDHAEVVTAREAQDRLEVGGLAVEVNREDRLGARRDRRREPGRVERERTRVNVHQHRRRAAQLNGHDRRHGGVRDGDDLIARPDAARSQRQVNRLGAAADADPKSHAQVSRKLALERRGFLAQNVSSFVEHSRDRLIDLWLMAFVLCAGVRLRDHVISFIDREAGT